LSLRSKYYGDAVKVVAAMAEKVMVYGKKKKKNGDSGENYLLNDSFRERHSPSTFPICRSTSTVAVLFHTSETNCEIPLCVLR
jgi:hypothetical protein